MENSRYGYLPITARPELKWPDGARVALWVCPNIEYFHFDQPVGSTPRGHHVPDVPGYALRDYGARVGVFRMMEVLDRHAIRASVLLNAEVCERHPAIIEEGKKRRWEWLGHGMTNSLRMNDYPPDEERSIIRQVKETIAAVVGTAPKGWLGPGLAETFNTPDHLAAEGFEYVCDWGCDDQPIPLRVQSGRMIALPYQQGINDITLLFHANYTPEQYLHVVCDQFDALYRESANGGRVMALPLHPYVIGLPFRIKYLDKALEYICAHEGVWRATGWEIVSWYCRHYYEPSHSSG
ncbi:MAG: polysaccharide deacetylase family protein [Candidatus Binatia bacterium]